MERLVRPGKCAPRLLEDLLRYDPRNAAVGARNVLIDPPAKLQHGGVLPVSVALGSCRHKYMIKPEQSKPPPYDSRPDSSTYYKIASYCSDCRCHLDLTVDFRTGSSDRPCPNEAFPLHHLRYDPAGSTPGLKSAKPQEGEDWVDQHQFVCSSPRCSAVVRISIRAPRLKADHVSLLTDPSKIKERVQREIDNSPERLKGFGIPEPIIVLQNLKQYLADALKAREKGFSADNKRYLTSLGEPCRPLLEYLGFKYEADAGNEFSGSWTLPSVYSSADGSASQVALRTLVDDVDKELGVLIDERPWAEKARMKASLSHHPTAAMKEMERCLGSLDYEKTVSARRMVDLTANENPCYAGLGAVSDFSDDLVFFAYERQRDCDPDHAPFYLDWLQEIARIRPSELLQTKVALMESSGEVSHREVHQAYRYFQANPTWDDASIIGAFRARLGDAPRQEAEARQCLRTIGIARRSESIQSAASNRVATYYEALTWLGAEDSTTDEFVLTLLTMKLDENKADTGLGREAIRLIAEYRKSDALKHWLVTGQIGEVDMDVGLAYTRLGIEDRELEDDMVLSVFNIRASEFPDEDEDLRAALRAIAKARQSKKLGWRPQAGQELLAPPPDWPVGLENIGNTCYLNSLLQFYFTVKPLREIILNFHEVEMEVTPASLGQKRVGSRKVSLKEIERAKKFIFELRKLFRTLMSASALSITPERELARLTLIKSSDEEDYRRRSAVGAQGRPTLGEINGVPVQGPVLPGPQSSSIDVDMDLSSVQHAEHVSSDDSEATLVDKHSIEGIDTDMQDAETINQVANGEDDKSDYVVVDVGKKSQGDMVDRTKRKSAERNNEMDGVASADKMDLSGPKDQGHDEPLDTIMTNSVAPIGLDESRQAPDRPPPIPPRPKVNTKLSESSSKPVDELELGAQQDVTEVIGNVMFQLECAMRPTGIDSNGEQLDEVKQLFYGKLRGFIEGKDGQRAKEEYFADIKVDVASGPRDIYDALDGAFDVQEVTMQDGRFPQYSSIAHLPPILQIQVQRVQYDVKNKQTYKSDAHLRLREEIYLDRYVDSEEPTLLQKRKQSWRWKEEFGRLAAKKAELLQTEVDISFPNGLGVMKGWVKDLQSMEMEDMEKGDVEVVAGFTQSTEEAKDEVEDIEWSMERLQEKLGRQFNGLCQFAYRLAAVFIHRGTATFGHYWIYIYDFQQAIWRKYNDGYVTEVRDPDKEIFQRGEDSSTSSSSNGPMHPPTPYYLVYVKNELKDVLIDPVCRHVSSSTTTTSEPSNTDGGGGGGVVVVEMQQKRNHSRPGEGMFWKDDDKDQHQPWMTITGPTMTDESNSSTTATTIGQTWGGVVEQRFNAEGW